MARPGDIRPGRGLSVVMTCLCWRPLPKRGKATARPLEPGTGAVWDEPALPREPPGLAIPIQFLFAHGLGHCCRTKDKHSELDTETA